ncbi:uncharacterized protein LOC125556346 [Triticum urartu]|uniref:uncharacterized protein LOC125556324 n=1 Tax=Triticum urartu TaxID=4572 RepID=UPI002042C791|nr:uncharacterized protein LOC125556324 [Triticum urartu]XP_048575052.1 uncharacterized protein LOC125556346 [Triticum urartu]
MGRSSSSPVHPERRGRSYVVRGVDATHGGHPLHLPMDKKDPLDPLLTLAPTTPSLTPFRSLPSASGATPPLTTRPGTSPRCLGTARGTAFFFFILSVAPGQAGAVPCTRHRRRLRRVHRHRPPSIAAAVVHLRPPRPCPRVHNDGVQEPDASVDDDSYYTGGAYYYMQAADDDQE